MKNPQDYGFAISGFLATHLIPVQNRKVKGMAETSASSARHLFPASRNLKRIQKERAAK